MDNTITARIGSRIRYYRKAAGFTQVSLAQALHRGKSVISKYERGEISLDIETLQQISAILGIPISLLIEDTIDKTAVKPLLGTGKSQTLESNYQVLYMYMYAAHRGKPAINRNIVHLGEKHACIYAELPDSSWPEAYKSFYSGQVQRETSFIRAVLTNPVIEHDIAIFEYQPPLKQVPYFMGFFCTLSIGQYFPLATKALFSYTPITNETWLIEKLTITAQEARAYRAQNGFFV